MPDGTDTTGLEFLEWKLRWEALIYGTQQQ